MECRTCLKITEKFRDLFTEDCNLLYKIESISSIQILVNKQFSSKICDSCVTNVELLYDFCGVVRRSNMILENRVCVTQNDETCANGNRSELEDDLIQIDEIKLESDSENSYFDDPVEIKKEVDENVDVTRLKTERGKKTVKKKKVFNCTDCDFTTEHFNLLRTHRTVHKGKQESKTVCNVCGKLIRTCNLTLHMSIHTASPVTCYNCEKVLKNKECLKKHMHLHKMVSIQCTYCEKVFHKRHSYYKHIRRHKVPTTNDDDAVVEKTPKNTVLGKLSRRRAFESFCTTRNFVITAATPVPELASILKDYAFNMRRQDGTDYKEATLKVLWNTTARDLQDRFLKEFQIKFDPFKDMEFAAARKARNTKRKVLKMEPDRRSVHLDTFTTEEIEKMAISYDEFTPSGLAKKFWLLASEKLAWQGSEAAGALCEHFTDELLNDGTPTGRICYNPIGDTKPLAGDKWLTPNINKVHLCPVRLFKNLISLRPSNASNRLFLGFNPNWRRPDSSWYIRTHIGKNTIAKWIKEAAKNIGLLGK